MRVRLSVDVEPELKGRLQVAAALRNISVKEPVEQAADHEHGSEPPERGEIDDAWLDHDLSALGAYEPYQWEPGELVEGDMLTLERDRGR